MKNDNRRLLKNTGLLYFRMIFLTLINLYAVRVTFEALGLIDYGVYNVIASVVASLSILTGAMTSASQRFLSFHLGIQDYGKYSHTFTLLLLTFIGIAAILLAVGEILGYFFIEDWLSIPKDRINAAYWVYQASLIAFTIGFVTIPYTSSIIANERMDAFAIFSIVEGILKLVIAWGLIAYNGDRLILYGILVAASTLIVFLMTMQYCHSKFKYCRYIWKWDRSIFSELSKYTGWNLFGSASGILSTAGQNILLNIFFGPLVNAAKGISDKIQQVISGFSTNLYMAASPQIIKSYASEDYERAMNLVIKTSKMAFLLIFILAFPLICSMEGILRIWLVADSNAPDMVVFSKLTLLYCMVLTLEQPISRIIQATGNIRCYQLYVGIITLSFLPIAAVALMLGASAPSTLIILIIIMSIAQIMRVIIAHRQVGLDYSSYLHSVVWPIVKTSVCAVPFYIMMEFFAPADADLTGTLIRALSAGIFALATGGFICLNTQEREMIINSIRTKIMSRKS